MSFLKIDSLKKNYGKTEVLKDINLDVEEGQFIVLLGPSGCGKSTLLNLIAGLNNISAGEIHINGRNVSKIHPANRNIAMVFQSYALYPNMTVRKNISFGLEIRNLDKKIIQEKTLYVAKMLQIEDLLDRKPAQLSGGQRQRVAMGRALVRDPDIFLFDEPLSNLDAKLRVDMRTEIKKLHKQLSTTIVYVTHDQIEALTLADKVVIMYEGKIQQLGSPFEVYNNPANVFVANFIGSPPMNLITGIVHKKGENFEIELTETGEDIWIPFNKNLDNIESYVEKEVILGVRPENISLFEADRVNGHAVLECDVEMIEPAGASTYVIIKLGNKEIMSNLHSDSEIQLKGREKFAVNLNSIVLFDPVTEQKIS